MKIPVDRLTASPTSFQFEGDSAWWRSAMSPQRGLPRELAEPLQFALRAHRMGEDLYIEGDVEGRLELECGRCLARYRHHLREPFRLVLEPAGGRTLADGEGADALARDGVCLGDEIESGWFRGGEIELGAFFLEVVSLALPVQPLCREDCLGLCPHCGADLGVATCECGQNRTDSPFSVLASLRDEETGGRS